MGQKQCFDLQHFQLCRHKIDFGGQIDLPPSFAGVNAVSVYVHFSSLQLSAFFHVKAQRQLLNVVCFPPRRSNHSNFAHADITQILCGETNTCEIGRLGGCLTRFSSHSLYCSLCFSDSCPAREGERRHCEETRIRYKAEGLSDTSWSSNG